MELRQLRAFVEISKTGNLTEASVNLSTSQPAISAQVRSLETELELTLFNRSAKGMTLTEAGEMLLSDAEAILLAIESLEKKAEALNWSGVKSIQIGLNTDSEVLRISQLIEHITLSFPKTEIHFKDVRSEEAAQALSEAQIDAGFYYGKIASPNMTQIKLRTYQMVVVYPEIWNLNDEAVSMEILLKNPWIWTTKGCPFYQETHEFFQLRGYEPDKIMYVDDEVLIGRLVDQGMACSLLAEPIAEQLAKENKIKIWRGLDLYVDLHFGFISRKEKERMFSKIASMLQNIWHEGL